LIAAQIASGDFTAVNACGNSLNPHSTCSIDVAFQPKNVGAIAGVLTVSDQYRTQTVMLNGTGIAPPGVSLAPFSTVTFPATGVGTTAAAQTVTLTNNGVVPLSVQSVVITGDFVIVPGSSSCGGSVAVNTPCTMQVAFAPTAGGPRFGVLTVTDNAVNSPQVLSLTGTGVDFTLNSNGGTSLTITNGQNAVYPLLLSSAANIPGTATFTCMGAPANSTCNVTPASVALGSTTTVSVTVLTGVSSAAISSRRLVNRPSMFLFATLLPVSLLALRRSRSGLAAFVLLGWLIAATGCGSGRAIPLESGSNPNPTPIPITPAGTYTIVASASSGGLTRSVDLTLIVQ
jgi:Abnormal spindle-like microcephaly-assoc'd, ASPM-SPD-2-Hydin